MNSTPFQLPMFYPILDTSVTERYGVHCLASAEALLSEGVQILQYRHKDAWTAAHYKTAAMLAKMCAETKCLFVVNDRADFACLLGAALHVGQHDLAPATCRGIVGSEAIIGFSTHTPEQMRQGHSMAVQYLSLGPIFSTGSKANPDPEIGLDHLKTWRHLTTKPLCAIGGITRQTAEQVLSAGADSMAVIADLFSRASNAQALSVTAREWMSLAVHRRKL